MKGIDISEFNDSINYDKLKADGIEFAIIRCGYGKNASQKDALFEQHYANCKRVGLKVGAYLYSYANTEEGAKLEAENCLRFIQGKKFDLPIFYDVEDNTTGKADKYTITKMCEIFCNKIIENGYQAGVYASLYWFNEKMYIEELEKYNIWLAQWNNEITANFKVDIWQYTSDGHVEGIGGRVDMNECYKYFDINGDIEKTGIYQNGSTKEPVYSDTKLMHQIGYLNPYESCYCYGIFEGRAIVRYEVDRTKEEKENGVTANYKIGFVAWLGGVK